MTDTGRAANHCLSDETIAAFVDGRLDPEARAQVERHAATCEECYRTLVDVSRMLRDLQRAQTVVPFDSTRATRRSRWYVATASLAAAAAVVLAVAVPLFLARNTPGRPELRDLVTAVGSTRPSEARLTGGFAWAPLDSAVRGGSSYRPSPSVQIAAARLEETLGADRSAAALAAFGTSRLVLGDAAGAVVALEEATVLDGSRPEYWSDLAGAYLTRADEAGNEADLPRALDAAETAIAIDSRLPEAWFNKALTLEKLGLVPQAREAWTTYLSNDTGSPWRDEATRHLEGLPTKPTPPSGRARDAEPLRQTLYGQLLAEWAGAATAGHSSGEALAKLRAAVTEIDGIAPDATARDLLRAIERVDAAPMPTQRSLAASYADFVRGQRALATEDFDGAAAAFAASAPGLSRSGSPLALNLRYNRAVIAYRRRNNVEARRQFMSLRPALEARGYVPLLARTDWMLGLLDTLQGRWREAGERYELARREFEAVGDLANYAAVRGLLASNYDSIGDPQRAWTLRVAALRGTPRPGVLLEASLSASTRGWLRAALVFAQAALATARDVASAPNMADALRIQAAIRAQLDEPEAVLDLVSEAKALVATRKEPAWDRVRAEIGLAEAQAASHGRVAAGIEAATGAIDFFVRTSSEGRLPELFAVRASLYSQTGDRERASADVRAGLETLERQRAHLAIAADQVTFEAAERRLIAQLVALAASDDAAADAFAQVDGSRGRDVGSAAATLTLDRLSQSVPPRTTFVEFVVGDDASHAWIVTAGRSAFQRIAVGRRALSDLVRAATPPRDDAAAIHKLSDLLIGPVEAHAERSSRLVIVPDGPLHALAFALLRQRSGERLIKDYSLLVTPNAGSWLRATARLSELDRGARALTAVGAPSLDRNEYPDLRDLPNAGDEAVHVAAFYPAARTTVLRGAEATRDAIVREFQQGDVIHFAGHAVTNPWVPDASFLALSGPSPSRLLAADIRHLALGQSRLVVLAACETAAGGRTIIESPLSLSRAFLAAGAPAVVGSLWLASDRASRALFADFHREFARSGDAAEALRRAQVSLSTSDDPSLTPSRQWAGFVVIGASADSAAMTGAER